MKYPRGTLSRAVYELQISSRYNREHSFAPVENKPKFPSFPVQNIVTVLTELIYITFSTVKVTALAGFLNVNILFKVEVMPNFKLESKEF
jgi:hypothetical protein